MLFAIGGLVVGVAISAPLQDALHLDTVWAMIGCGTGGLIIGTLISTLVDVFTASADEAES